MAQQVRSLGADIHGNIALWKEIIAMGMSVHEAIENLQKSERAKKLENAQNYIGTILIHNYKDYPDVINIYREIQKNGGLIKLSNGRILTENGFIIGLSAYCGLSDFIVQNGVNQDAIFNQCDARLGVLEISLKNGVIQKDDFLLMLDAFQMDVISDAAYRAKKWTQEQNKKLETALQPTIQKLEKARNKAKDKADEMKKWRDKKIWRIF